MTYDAKAKRHTTSMQFSIIILNHEVAVILNAAKNLSSDKYPNMSDTCPIMS